MEEVNKGNWSRRTGIGCPLDGTTVVPGGEPVAVWRTYIEVSQSSDPPTKGTNPTIKSSESMTSSFLKASLHVLQGWGGGRLFNYSDSWKRL